MGRVKKFIKDFYLLLLAFAIVIVGNTNNYNRGKNSGLKEGMEIGSKYTLMVMDSVVTELYSKRDSLINARGIIIHEDTIVFELTNY